MKCFVTLITTFVLITTGYTQQPKKEKRPVAYGGIGAGLDYGGFGMKAEILPIPSLGIFAGAGYNLDGIGVNGGLSFKLMPQKKTAVYFTAMYGYNAVIVLKSTFSGFVFSDTYYGFSAGGGLDFSVGRNRNKVSLGILVPFRSAEFDADFDLYNNAGYSFNTKPTDVLISIGFNVAGYNKKK